jgi:glycosyltransferase 2 family protein
VRNEYRDHEHHALRRPRKLVVPLWARALVSVVLIGLVISQLHGRTVVRRLSDGQWGWFAVAAGLMLLALTLGAVRWHLLLAAAGIARSVRHTLRVYWIGAFANCFLPTGFGGDALRVLLAGPSGTRTRAAVTVVVDRATMLAAATAFAWVSAAAWPGTVPTSLLQALAVVTALTIAAGLIAGGVIAVSALADKRRPSRVTSLVAGVARTVGACFRGHVIWQTTLLGVGYEALAVLAMWLLARSISLEIPFAVLAVAVPTVLLLTALPISVGGLGVREGAYIVLLHQAGVTTTDAALLSLLATVVLAIVSLPGALGLLTSGQGSRVVPDGASTPRSTSA